MRDQRFGTFGIGERLNLHKQPASDKPESPALQSVSSPGGEAQQTGHNGAGLSRSNPCREHPRQNGIGPHKDSNELTQFTHLLCEMVVK